MVSANQFWNSIKARQIGYAIIIVPLAILLAVLLCLLLVLNRFEKAIESERHARQVMTAVDDLYFKQALLVVLIGRQIVGNGAARIEDINRQVKTAQEDCRSLDNLVKEDGPRKTSV